MIAEPRPHGGGGAMLGRASLPDPPPPSPPAPTRTLSPELAHALAEVKGQAQFLLYLADQVEESLHQLATETDTGHAAFLGKLLSMYSNQLETRHQGLGERIAETCQEVYLALREYDLDLDA